MEAADSDLRWSAEDGAYRRQTLTYSPSGATTFFQRYSTTSGTRASGDSPEIAEARRFEARLQSAFEDDSFLVLMVEPQAARLAEEELIRRFPAFKRRRLDRLVLQALRDRAGKLRGTWE